jgi:hypothetical protein
VVCETIKAALDSLPGDERTLVGLVTYDAHVHFYNLSACTLPCFEGQHCFMSSYKCMCSHEVPGPQLSKRCRARL